MDELSSDNKNSWWSESFRIEKVDPHTLHRRVLLDMKRWKIALVGTIAGILLFIVFFFFVGYTPLRKILPGRYSQLDIPEMITLRTKMSEMEEVMMQQDRYINSLRSILTGKPVDSLQQSEVEEIPEERTEVERVERIPEDTQLRESLEMETRLNSLRRNIRNRTSSLNPIDSRDLNLIPPVIGPMGKDYDPGVNHYGIDILAPKNTAIKSIADGIVLQADWTVETGNTIMILHDNGLISTYKHNSSLLKKNYDRVSEGEAIAIIGNTGTLTTGPHVHFELWVDGFPENPAEFINFQ